MQCPHIQIYSLLVPKKQLRLRGSYSHCTECSLFDEAIRNTSVYEHKSDLNVKTIVLLGCFLIHLCLFCSVETPFYFRVNQCKSNIICSQQHQTNFPLCEQPSIFFCLATRTDSNLRFIALLQLNIPVSRFPVLF